MMFNYDEDSKGCAIFLEKEEAVLLQTILRTTRFVHGQPSSTISGSTYEAVCISLYSYLESRYMGHSSRLLSFDDHTKTITISTN